MATKARFAFAALGALAFTATPSTSHAQAIDCGDAATLPNPVFVYGSSAVRPLIASLGASLWGTISIIYVSGGGSCDGVNAIVKGNKASGSGLYWPNGAGDGGAPTSASCNISGADAGGTGVTVDLGVSDVWPETCPDVTNVDYTTIGDFHGPNQVMTFAVPLKSTVKSISAEQAYFVMGKVAGMKIVEPWTDATKLIIRNQLSGTQAMLGKAIKLPGALWQGKDAGGSSGVVSALKTANMTDPTFNSFLGIISTAETDVDKDNIKVLAFQEFGKKCSFWPDTSLTVFDKANVRKGDYAVFGPLHLLTKVAANVPTNANVKKIVDYFTDAAEPPGGKTQLLDLEIGAHTVPQCAMHVERTTEMGPLKAYKAPVACDCYFEFKAAGGKAPTGCTVCATDADCADAGTKTSCNYGYCEVK